MRRPDGMPFQLYRIALKRLNARIDAHLRGAPHVELLRLKPLPIAIARIFGGHR